jgi:protease I
VQRLPGLRSGSGAAGGRYADIPVDQATVDGNLVTAPAWPAHPDWLAKFLKVLGSRIEA